MATRKTTTRTPRARKSRVNDAETLKDTQEINQVATESLGTQVDPGKALRQKGQFNVGEFPQVLEKMAYPPEAAVKAQEASDKQVKEYGQTYSATVLTLPEGRTEGTWSFTVDGKLIDGLTVNSTSQDIESKLSDAGFEGSKVTVDGSSFTIRGRFEEPVPNYTGLTAPEAPEDPETP